MASLAVPRVIALVSVFAATTAASQQSDSARRTVAPAVAAGPEQYEPVFDQLSRMKARADSVATVHNVSLRRDAIQLQLADGKLYLATPVAGRTIAVIYVGHGSVSFAPPLAIERHEVRRYLGDSVLTSPISAAALVFTDSTLTELERQVTFGAGGDAGRAADVLHDALDRLVDGRDVLQPTLISAVMNAETDGFFYAHVKREHGEDLMFELDPRDDEPISLLRNGREGNKIQVLSEFRLAGDSSGGAAALPPPESRSDLRVDSYRIEATIPKGLGFSANSTLRLTARRDGVRWVPLNLLSELQVDTVSDETGAPLTFFRTKKSPVLWVRFATPARAGDARWVHVAYHGDLIGYTSIVEQMTRWWPMWLSSQLHTSLDRWYYVKSSYDWFPRYGAQPSDVDLTFHTSQRYRLASIGRLVDSYTRGDMVTTHWTTERPADQVCFSVGELSEFKITDPRIPPVTVHSNDEAHHQLDRFFLTLEDKIGPSLWVGRLLSRQSPEQEVGGDVANSLAFFTRVYGKPLFERYYAAEIPFDYGQAFPGLIYLPVWTFQAMGDSGYDEILRAHEVAHQWWGIGVEPATYRDHWLSEGFAEFSGWWYMQLVLRDNPKFFKHLEHWRKEIRARRNDASPIGIGTRAAYRNPRDAYLMTYYKGAWVLQMLRNMMIDFRTMKEDAFAEMMQDFYSEYRGKRATTQDFQRVVERHTGLPMDWFFDEWVNGTAIPTYVLSWRADTAANKSYAIHLRIRQEDVPADFVMPVPVRIELAGGGHAFVRVNVRGPRTEVELRLPDEPTEVELNPLQSVLADVKTEAWE